MTYRFPLLLHPVRRIQSISHPIRSRECKVWFCLFFPSDFFHKEFRLRQYAACRSVRADWSFCCGSSYRYFFNGILTTMPFIYGDIAGTFAVQFPQDPFGNIAAGGAASSNAVSVTEAFCYLIWGLELSSLSALKVVNGLQVGSTSPGTAAKNPPPRPAPPKSTSARQTPVNGDPFANT